MIKIGDLKYLVVGLPRSGTTYMARLLASVNVMCGHESIFTPNGLEEAKNKILYGQRISTSLVSNINVLENQKYDDWFDPEKIQAESSYMAAPYLNDECIIDSKIIHVVRNPLKVISSLYFDLIFFNYDQMDEWKAFVLNHLPELKLIKNEIERACYFYLCWNQMIEKSKYTKEYLLHKVENQCNQNLIDFLKIEHPKTFFSNTTMNSWKKDRQKDITFNDIPNGTIKKDFIEMSIKYGYFEKFL